MSIFSKKHPSGPTIDVLHQLDHSQFEKALEILREEQAANQLTRAQRVNYRLLIMTACCGILFFVLLFGGTAILGEYARFPRLLDLILVCLMFVALFFSPFLLLLNLPLLGKVRRQIKLIRKLNLQELYTLSWQGQKKKLRWVKFLWVFMIIIGIAYVGIGIFGTIETFYKSENATFDDCMAILMCLLPGITLLLLPLIILWKKKMDTMMNVENLKQSLVQYREVAESKQSEFIEVPLGTMSEIASIELSQIARQRAEAIDGISIEGIPGYRVRRSKNFQESVARIEPVERLKLEERIEGLLEAPHPEEAVPSSDQEASVVNIPGTSYALTYAVDDSLRQIDLLEIQLSTAVCA